MPHMLTVRRMFYAFSAGFLLGLLTMNIKYLFVAMIMVAGYSFLKER